MNEPIHILSLGAGVQSSTLALMSAKGEVTPMPIAAIFADTGDEPQSVYAWLEWPTKQLPFPVHVVSKGKLSDDFLAALRTEKGRCGQPPFFVKNNRPAGAPGEKVGSVGVLWRKCTAEYKLSPIRKQVRKLAEMHGAKTVKQWIGISLDEAHRMKPSGVKYIENIFPLIEARISRRDCLKWMKDNGYPEPPKSACVYCPYHNDALWRKMKHDEPQEFGRAIKFERAIKKEQATVLNGAKISGDIFLHRSCVPLDQVDFSNKEERGGQADLFGNECEGMCGV